VKQTRGLRRIFQLRPISSREPVGANAPLLPIHTATVVANHEREDERGSRSMTVGRQEEIRRRLDEGRGGHETFMRELRGGFAIAQREALTKEAKAQRLAPRLTQERARVQERQATPSRVGRRQSDP
jgi:hypothetical protein